MAAALVCVRVDVRERALIPLIPDAEVAALDLGDIQVDHVIMERKTPADLAASIADGRWRDQLRRLRDAKAKGYVPCVVIEGAAGWGWDQADAPSSAVRFGPVPASALPSALLGAALRDGIPFFATSGPRDTAALVARVRDKVSKMRARHDRLITEDTEDETKDAPGSSGLGGDTGPRATTGRLLKKSDGLTARAIAVAQLGAVPGISEATASSLLGDHQTLYSWLSAGCAAPAVLCEMRVGNRGAGGGGRRLGAAAAARVHAYLLAPAN